MALFQIEISEHRAVAEAARLERSVALASQIEAAVIRYVRLAKEAREHVKQYYPEGVTYGQFQMIYADAFQAEAELNALKAQKRSHRHQK